MSAVFVQHYKVNEPCDVLESIYRNSLQTRAAHVITNIGWPGLCPFTDNRTTVHYPYNFCLIRDIAETLVQ